MKPVTQLILTDDPAPGAPLGDCVRGCVASIFELQAADVPHFTEGAETQPGPDGLLPWIRRLKDWARARGFEVLFREVGSAALHWPAAAMQFHHMRLGVTAQGDDHWCVYYGDKMVHDPRGAGFPGFREDVFPQYYLIFVKL